MCTCISSLQKFRQITTTLSYKIKLNLKLEMFISVVTVRTLFALFSLATALREAPDGSGKAWLHLVILVISQVLASAESLLQ